MKTLFYIFSILSITIIAALIFFVSKGFLWALILVIPIIILGIVDTVQTKQSIRRNFPVVGHGRYMAEWLRPKMFQYFIESDTDGKPISRIFRNIIYQRSKNVRDTTPFGTQLDVYAEGYEWMNHSISAKDHHDIEPDLRIKIGGPDCLQPYSCSLFNVAAMSFGSLSKNAIMALNGGAAIGDFAHNTGEGGVSPYHLKHGGDLIYQIGTGYFGCRAKDGGFDPDSYKELVKDDRIKMIELKLSQGAKPGHGGILPASKVTPEIAKIRNIEMGKDVLSPPYHKAFSDPLSLLQLIKQMRDLSGGKPIGFKLCVGHKSEFLAICKAMVHTGIKPDFITVDGGEGGTGAAPLEFSNSVGMPYKEGLVFIYDALIGFDLKKDIKIIASGKIITGFHIFRAIALGADVCYSARAMMMALGCIQALECNKNSCPVGVATQDPSLVKGLDVSNKKLRVANYHRETIESFIELLAAAGLTDPDKINRSHVNKRVVMNTNQRYDEIFPLIPKGVLTDPYLIPADWKGDMTQANMNSFLPMYEQVYTE